MQSVLVDIWAALYSGIVCAVRDWDTEDSTWDEADNTYSGGRTVMIQTRIEPWQESDSKWEHNRFMSGDGADNEHPRGTICHISPRTPMGDRGDGNASQTDLRGEFAAYREMLRPATDWAQDALARAEHLEDADHGGSTNPVEDSKSQQSRD